MKNKYSFGGRDSALRCPDAAARRPCRAFVRRLLYFCLLISAFCFRASVQSYSIDWYKVSGGGGTSTGATYQVTGTIGGVEYVNGKPTSNLDSWAGCNVQHTFTMAGLGINVPIASPTTVNENSNLCGNSPCTSGPHQVVTFSFMTPAKGGTFRWQCIVPCGLGYVDGNGGPMATPGYMSGQMEVQA